VGAEARAEGGSAKGPRGAALLTHSLDGVVVSQPNGRSRPYTCMHACMHACMYVCIYIYIYICIYIYIYIYIHIYTYTYICLVLKVGDVG